MAETAKWKLWTITIRVGWRTLEWQRYGPDLYTTALGAQALMESGECWEATPEIVKVELVA